MEFKAKKKIGVASAPTKQGADRLKPPLPTPLKFFFKTRKAL